MAGKGEEVYVASIDQGTTSTRFIVYDRHASPVASHQLEFKQHYPEAGLESKLSGGRTHFVETCGLPISTYFSALKLLWLMENVDAVKDAVKAGDALFGTIDTWLIWNLTGGIGGKDCDGKELVGRHVTDCSNASRTMLMNLKALDWDKPTLEALGIPAGILPKIVSNSEKIGVVASGFPLAGVSISGCLGDQHAAMLGQLCQKDVPTNYALEGSIAIAGAAVQWLRDSLGIISSAAEIEG
ncbi:glycerol kinase [Hordeum vulgare]|nr:glycerol kinase [Hordeum vulgare]